MLVQFDGRHIEYLESIRLIVAFAVIIVNC